MFLFFKYFFRENKNRQSGFTLLELVVVIAIFLIITGVVVSDIPSFRNRSSLDLVTNEVATYVRGAQVYGTSQKSNIVSYPKYGTSFDSNSPSSFFLFVGDPATTEGREYYNVDGFKLELFERGNTSSTLNGKTTITYEGRINSLLGSNLTPIFNNENDNISGINCLVIKIISQKDGQSSCVFVYKNGQIMVGDCSS